MNLTWIQIWAGLFYLLNKMCFSRAERSLGIHRKRTWRIRSWIVYLSGLPAWVFIFIAERDWIAAGVESGGAPAMLTGLIIAWRGRGTEPGWLDLVARASVGIGLLLSLYEFGGLKNPSQFLELAISAGFLLGTYLMAKNDIKGYLWLMLGNVACASLMGIQSYWILMLQQLMSLVFVIDAYRVRKRGSMVSLGERLPDGRKI